MERTSVRTFTGQNVDLIDTAVDSINIYDIAHHLSKLDRYNGAGSFPYSVGYHSLLVAECLPEEYRLWGLLHDATEAYLGDVVSPLKSLLPGYRDIEQHLMAIIAGKFLLNMPRPPEVKAMDTAVMVAEMNQVMNWPDLAAQQGVPSAPVRIYQREWQDVRAEFLSKFEEYRRVEFFAKTKNYGGIAV